MWVRTRVYAGKMQVLLPIDLFVLELHREHRQGTVASVAASGHWHGHVHGLARGLGRCLRGEVCRLRRQMLTQITQQLFHFDRKLHPSRRVTIVLGQNDDAAEQSAIDVDPYILEMIVKRPGADHLIGHVKSVSPVLAGTDLVRPAAIGGLGAEWPRPVRVDTVLQPLHMEAERPTVSVENEGLEPPPTHRVEARARTRTGYGG